MSGEEEAPGVQSNFVLLLLPLRSTKAGQEARHLCLSARMQVGGGGGGMQAGEVVEEGCPVWKPVPNARRYRQGYP